MTQDARGQSGFLFGQVMHRRLRPFGNVFKYRLFSMVVDVDAIAAEARDKGVLFGVDRPALLSFYARDHGPRDGSALRPWIEAKLREAGCGEDVKRIRIVAFPRVLGYVFNPISVWFCERADGSTGAVLYEVNNTFGERRSYLFTDLPAAHPGEVLRHACGKAFHVSPFFDVSGGYAFRTRVPDARYDIAITFADEAGAQLFAAQTGRFARLSARSCWTALLAYPLLTFGVVAAIHWQALKLVLRGVKYRSKPPPPATDIVHISPAWPAAAE